MWILYIILFLKYFMDDLTDKKKQLHKICETSGPCRAIQLWGMFWHKFSISVRYQINRLQHTSSMGLYMSKNGRTKSACYLWLRNYSVRTKTPFIERDSLQFQPLVLRWEDKYLWLFWWSLGCFVYETHYTVFSPQL